MNLVAPPRVRWVVGPGVWLRRFVAACGLLTGLVLVACLWAGMPMLRLAFLLCISLLIFGLAWRALARTPQGVLQWTGKVWLWNDDSGATSVHVHTVLSLPRFVLLKLQSDRGALHWLGLESRSLAPQGTADGHWRALRRALAWHGARREGELEPER